MAMVRGTASCEGKDINPMDTVPLKGISTRCNGDVLVTGVQHQITHGTWVTVIQFDCLLNGLVNPKIFTHPAAGMLPAIQSLQIGKVLEQVDKDPDKQDRIKISLPTIDAKKGSGHDKRYFRQVLYSACKR